MSDEDEQSPGTPYGGVAIACRVMNYELIKCENNIIIAVLIKDAHDNPVQLVLSMCICSTHLTNCDNNQYLNTDISLVIGSSIGQSTRRYIILKAAHLSNGY